MPDSHNLQRFLDAQKDSYTTALSEINAGRKRSHWMWYIFPQIAGLGISETAKFYAIKNIQEANAYVQHPLLGSRLLEITHALLQLKDTDPFAIFGSLDDMKLRSSLTLFASTNAADPVFGAALDKFFKGEKDRRTLQLLAGGLNQ